MDLVWMWTMYLRYIVEKAFGMPMRVCRRIQLFLLKDNERTLQRRLEEARKNQEEYRAMADRDIVYRERNLKFAKEEGIEAYELSRKLEGCKRQIMMLKKELYGDPHARR